MIGSKRILVLGAGAIGGYIGGSLVLSGHDVRFLCREKTAHSLRSNGLTLLLPEGEHHLKPAVETQPAKIFSETPFDLIVLAVKRYDTVEAVSPIIPFRDQLPPILNIQNGLDAEATLAGVLDKQDIIPATVTTAVGRKSRHELVVDKFRGVGIAGDHEDVQFWVQAFAGAGMNARFYPDPEQMKWSKLVTNLIANPVSAILDYRPAQIYAHPGLFELEMRQLREALTVMKALGISVADLPGTPVRLLAFCARFLPLPLAQLMLSRALGKGRGDKMPSFHVDLHSNSGKSEIGDLHGAVVRYGEQVGIPTPVNKLLVQVLSGMIKREIPLSAFRHQPGKLLSRLPG